MSKVFVTKLLLETLSPLAINSGSSEEGFDTQLARDFNGLPYIPASAIAGVWGHLVSEYHTPSRRDKWFGDTQQASSLILSNGILHDAKNQPIGPFIEPQRIQEDPILNLLVQDRPHHRERVAINDRGVAKETGKFDQLLLPKGVRFSITLKWSTQDRQDNEQLDEKEWQELLALWNDRKLAFGASTRNGLGKVQVIACEQQHFDLSSGPSAGHAMQSFLNTPKITGNTLPNLTESKTLLLASLPMQAIDNWRCGSGSHLLGENNTDGIVSMITYSEPQIDWHNDQAKLIMNQAVLCGSSIKGILAHRMAYHLRRHKQIWAEDMAEASHDDWQKAPEDLEELFGFASNTSDNGKAGKLYIEDSKLTDYKTLIRTHNKIDRFTGGVQEGALYSEELLYQPKFTLNIWIESSCTLSEPIKHALRDTLTDLQTGLLPMGAGSGRGTSLVMQQPNSTWTFHASALDDVETAKE